MTQQAHTPGPWTLRFAENLTAISTPKGEMQLSLHGVYNGLKPLSVSLQEWQANAALVAAAPELLTALNQMVAVWEGPRARAAFAFADAVKAARAAIAKATR